MLENMAQLLLEKSGELEKRTSPPHKKNNVQGGTCTTQSGEQVHNGDLVTCEGSADVCHICYCHCGSSTVNFYLE